MKVSEYCECNGKTRKGLCLYRKDCYNYWWVICEHKRQPWRRQSSEAYQKRLTVSCDFIQTPVSAK